jgi:hypothetical protein
MSSPHSGVERPRRTRLATATMWARLRPDLTVETALAALDDIERCEQHDRATYRRPARSLYRASASGG